MYKGENEEEILLESMEKAFEKQEELLEQRE